MAAVLNAVTVVIVTIIISIIVRTILQKLYSIILFGNFKGLLLVNLL